MMVGVVAVIALVLSGLSLSLANSALGLVQIVESEQASAVRVEAARQARDDEVNRKLKAQAEFNKAAMALIKELMK